MSLELSRPSSRFGWLIGILIAAVCIAHFFFLEFWLHYKLGTFYCFRLDDVFRIWDAHSWGQTPSLLPDQNWLPLPSYLLGTILNFSPDPWMIPLRWHNFLAAATLATLGMVTLELFPERPVLALLPIALAPQIPYFERMALSAGAEVDLWFFMLLSAWSWLLYLRKKTIGYAWLNAACFFLVSMTRYEAWLFILAFLPIQIWSINKKEGLSWKVLALPLLAVAYVIFFICYQEISLSSSKGILPLSWRGMRLYFRGEYPGAIRSFLEPLSLWFNFSPALTVLEISGAVYALVKRPELRGYILWISLSGLFLCLEAGIVGISAAVPGRLVVIFHLLQIPLICSLLEPLVPQKVPVWAGLIAPVAGMFFLQASMPRLTESDLLNHTRDGFIIAKAVHEVELAEYIRPHMLVERQLGPGPEVFDYTPMFFATFERFIGDRKENYNPAQLSLITENNPSVFSLKKGELERYLRQHHIGWIVTCSQGSLDALKGLSSPVATSGGRTLSAYQLPEYIVERARNVIKDVERSVNHDKNGF